MLRESSVPDAPSASIISRLLNGKSPAKPGNANFNGPHMLTIITCTYNPNAELLERLFTAVEAAVVRFGMPVEYIVVDNVSDPGIESHEFVRRFMRRSSWARIIVEPARGLSSARCAGIRAAQGEWIVFFDDDNEPDSGYLKELQQLVLEYPDVGCFGAGRVDVEFPEATSRTVRQFAGDFQQREMDKAEFSLSQSWCDYFPMGTGLCVRRDIVLSYEEKVAMSEYTLSDRTGRSLASGGDFQIGLESVRLGYRVGSSPSLHITHMIEPRKAAFSYLLRLRYGVASSYHLARRQVFPDVKIDEIPVNSKAVLRRMWWNLILVLRGRSGIAQCVMQCVQLLADVEAQLLANRDLRRPMALRFCVRALRLQ